MCARMCVFTCGPAWDGVKWEGSWGEGWSFVIKDPSPGDNSLSGRVRQRAGAGETA